MPLNNNFPSLTLELDRIATKKAFFDAGLQTDDLTIPETLVHRALNDVFYVFYPRYTQVYHAKQIELFTEKGRISPYVPSSLKEGVLFIHRFIASPTSIGSIFPSSKNLIDAMTKKISEGVTESIPPRRYLDVGAGTGSFTEGIIAKMRPEDELDVVEYDLDLCNVLKRRFGHLPNVHIHHVSIFEFNPSYQYDVVVTGLPLNNFSSESVGKVFEKYEELTRPRGSFCYFEYLFLPSLSQAFKRAFASLEELQNFEQVLEIKRQIQKQFPVEEEIVYWNLTPAKAIHCQVISV